MGTDYSPGVRFPYVDVELTGTDGNAFAVIAAVRRALLRKVTPKVADEWSRAAMDCASYDELLHLAMVTVNVS